MPLTDTVNFKTILQRGNRLQIPKQIRWRYKLECDQILKVDVNLPYLLSRPEQFYARMTKDGRILVPQLIITILKGDKPNLDYHLFIVTLKPS